MIAIGITGGIGCGKSYVAKMLQRLNIPVYDSDSHARSIILTDSAVRSSLIRLVGEELYENGEFKKEVLSRFIFGNEAHLQEVNAIVHPAVQADFVAWKQSVSSAEFCILESAILYESGFDGVVDCVTVVDAPLALRLERCIKRDNCNEEAVMSRINSQMGQADKCRMADYVIINDGVVDVMPQVEEMLNKFRTINFINKNRRLC